MSVPRVLRGTVFVAPHRRLVRVQIETGYGSFRCETYIALRDARALRDDLDRIIKAASKVSA